MKKVIVPGASGKLYWSHVVENPLVSVRVGTRGAEGPLEAAIRQALARDERYLQVDIQGDGELSFWQMSIAWGSGDAAVRKIIHLDHDEHDPDAMVRRMLSVLASREFSASGPPLDAVELRGSVLDYRDPFEPVAVEESESR
jgi:hypothetical protein